MKKIVLISFLLFLFICNSFNTLGQSIENVKKIQRSKLFVVIDQNEHDNNPKYAELFKKYWTFNEVEVIESSQIVDNLKVGNFFLTIKFVYEEGFKLDKPASKQKFYLCMWTVDEKKLAKFERKSKGNKDVDFSEIADEWGSTPILVDKSDPFKVSDFFSGEYFGNGHALFGGLGFVKNYIQRKQLNYEKVLRGEEIEKEKKEKINFMGLNKKQFVSILNEKEVDKLKEETLYVPATLLVDNALRGPTFSTYVMKKRPPLKAKDVFDGYPGKYEVLSLEEINEKIMTTETPFYYLMKDGNFNIQIVNALTGEIIFKQEIQFQDTFDAHYLDELSDILEQKK